MNTCHFGDCLEVMPTMEEGIVDSVVCDPPYGLGFMGKDWDHGVPGAHFWAEALRVAKPGAYLLAFGGTRTYHRLTCAIEDAGWEIRDCLMWVYGSGFPKSKNLDGDWKGFGTGLKPAWEPIILARKPLNGNVSQNVLAHGVGVLNIAACKVNPGEVVPGGGRSFGACDGVNEGWKRPGHAQYKNKPSHSGGRWPANLIHDGSDEVLATFPQAPGQQGHSIEDGAPQNNSVFGAMKRGGPHHTPRNDTGSAARFFYCAKASKKDRDEGCESLDDKVLAMSNQAKAEQARGNLHSGDSGMNTGKKRKNNHPTVKPTELMRYLCRLVTPPGGLILDPFMGSGSTGKAALLENFRFVGIELNPEYIDIARARISAAGNSRRGVVAQTGMVFT
jgi:site-specific DNA-methyltransferase (adenine-specific)